MAFQALAGTPGFFTGARTRHVGLTRRFKKGRKLNKRQKRQVKRLVTFGRELKFKIGQQAFQTVSTVGATSGASFDVAQGQLDTERIGDRLMWAGNIELRVSVVGPQGGGLVPNDIYDNVRMIIFQWHPNSSPTINGTDILLPGYSGAIDYLSTYNHDNRQEYKILFDKTFTMVNAEPIILPVQGYAPNHTMTKRFIIPLKKASKLVQYSGGTLVGTNRIYTFIISDSSAAPHPTIAWSTKIFFRDP